MSIVKRINVFNISSKVLWHSKIIDNDNQLHLSICISFQKEQTIKRSTASDAGLIDVSTTSVGVIWCVCSRCTPGATLLLAASPHSSILVITVQSQTWVYSVTLRNEVVLLYPLLATPSIIAPGRMYWRGKKAFNNLTRLMMCASNGVDDVILASIAYTLGSIYWRVRSHLIA